MCRWKLKADGFFCLPTMETCPGLREKCTSLGKGSSCGLTKYINHGHPVDAVSEYNSKIGSVEKLEKAN